MGWLNDAFGFVKDVHKNTFAVPVTLYNVITGDHSVKIDYDTGAGKLASQLQGDVTKSSVQPLSKSFDSITGYDTDLQFETGAGKAGAGAVSGLADGIHGALKATANGVSGGLATKLTNGVRDPQYREGDGTALFNLTGKEDNEPQNFPTTNNTASSSFSFLGSGSIVGLVIFLFFIFLSKNK